MRKRIQFGAWLVTAAMCALLAAPGFAQKAQNRPPAPAPKASRPANPNRPPAAQNRAANRPTNRQVNHPPMQGPANRPNGNNAAGANAVAAERPTARQQLGVGAPRPWVDRMRDLSPQQRDQVMKNSPAFQKMPAEQQNRIRNMFNQWDGKTPQQKADQREKETVWRNLTPEQRQHIKNDVLPAWRQLPAERQNAISNRLRVLQNMPESARNQRLNDPNFTKDLNEEDRATLRDLSHLHVGGPPDAPNE
jgi:uncharacterized protein DUF3106